MIDELNVNNRVGRINFKLNDNNIFSNDLISRMVN